MTLPVPFGNAIAPYLWDTAADWPSTLDGATVGTTVWPDSSGDLQIESQGSPAKAIWRSPGIIDVFGPGENLRMKWGLYNGSLSPLDPNQWFQFVYQGKDTEGSSARISVQLRICAGGDYYFIFDIIGDTCSWDFGREGDIFTDMGSGTVTVAAGDIFLCQVLDGTVTLLLNGTPLGSAVDSSDTPLDIGNFAFFVNNLDDSFKISFGAMNFGSLFPAGVFDSCFLPNIVRDVCERSGLKSSQIDTSLLNAVNVKPTHRVMGYAIKRPTKATEVLQPLMVAHFFDACETNGTIKFVPMGLAKALTIPEADLGLLADMTKVVEQIMQEQDLPKNFTVTYDDPTLDYQQNRQLKSRNSRIVNSKQAAFIDLPITLIHDWAQQIAAKALYLAWLERTSFKLNLWRASYLLLDPTDVVEFVYQSITFAMRVKANSVGANLASMLEGAKEYAQLLVSEATGGAGLAGGRTDLQLLGPTSLFLFDIPLLHDVDSNPENTGFYFAMSSALLTWSGGVLDVSTDNSNFAQGGASAQPVTFGVATNILGAPRSPWTWDNDNSLTVNLQRGTFASDTDLNVLNGANALLVGDELIQFATVAHNPDGSWTLSRLLRGRRGTEWACGTHAPTELVIMPATGIQRVPNSLPVLNQQRWYRGVTAGQDPSTVPSTEFTIIGRDLMPYAPVHIVGTRDGGLNLNLTWTRRTRVGWSNLAQDPVPLSEDSEAYQVDIYIRGFLVRSITGLTSPAASYSAAQQTTDFGSPQSSISLQVFQLSAQVGKGFAASATV